MMSNQNRELTSKEKRSIKKLAGQLYDLESTGARNGDLYAGESL